MKAKINPHFAGEKPGPKIVTENQEKLG